jgi:hypothetical protein
MITETHPYFFLESLFSRPDAVFSFSRYVYTPDSVFDEREVFETAGHDITAGWLENQIEALHENQELAIHSRVIMQGRAWHIPMLDFATTRISNDELSRLRAFLPAKAFRSAAFFNSGRSFHLYSEALITPKEWLEFLGRALLVNPREEPPIIDSRWIGHRLLAGYCSLRLSNSSNQYRGMPRRVGLAAMQEGTLAASVAHVDNEAHV